ncbi:alkaline phosphatase D family protein [Limnoglobus roseus]|uniref:Alkaline phosphatase n=1 Tax=Limnoglobus roseus TaxID=2598579 RepID=A0A5C1ADF0_9BACT|nr:alkaline phosphatase D family protein [Limnoglobus roseus]QEL16243.1 alkaline phosphatase [Limnoglobus roseus]
MGEPSVDRRSFVTRTVSAAAALSCGSGTAAEPTQKPNSAVASEPPGTPCGVASGDVTHDTAVVWSRTDGSAKMVVEYATTADFRQPRRAEPVAATPEADFTAKALLAGLPPGHTIYYRVWFDDNGRVSPPVSGRFRTAPAPDKPADVFFAWSGDTAGQGFGINPEWGGMRIYDAIRRLEPQFFLHSGDNIYADNPIPESLKLADGTIWRNVTTPAKSHQAVTLEDFRGNYRYNLLDEHVRRFNAEVPTIVQWDDHEVANNWYPDQAIAGRKDAVNLPGVRDGRALADRARQAFFEYLPIKPQEADRGRIYRSFQLGTSAELFVLDQRSYRGPNSANTQDRPGRETPFLGGEQLAWLKQGLRESKATWKIIASDMPIGLIVDDAVDGKPHFEAIANADPGSPRGRELEFADLFTDLKQGGVRNVVWLTADVHYAAALHYSPERAGFKSPFEPFWEFVAGPMHAGTFGPNKLDATFGPEVRFEYAPRAGLLLPTGRTVPEGFKLPLPPSDGMQTFGTVRIDAVTQTLTVEFRNVFGDRIHDGTRIGRFELQVAK